MFAEKNFHLVGIGGIGVSGLGRILRDSGKTVSGSDVENSPVIEKLQAEGFSISIPQRPENLQMNAEVVIYSTAVSPKNSELVEAKKRGLKVLSYPEALGQITKNKRVIAVAGTHGKTTTTSLIIAACLAAGEDISCLVGTNLTILDDQNARLGKSDWFVIEACEYRRAFLNLCPTILVVTNIEAEHLDYFQDLTDYESAFIELVRKLPENGVLVANSHETNLSNVISKAPHFFDAANVQLNFSLKIPGEHNRRNATLAFVVSELLNLDATKAYAGIENFNGGWRRFEDRGEFHGAKIIDDYAHHPTEIQATLAAAREKFPTRRIIIVYQQHQVSRAKKFFTELGACFSEADVVVIPNIYAVRDENEKKLAETTAKDLVKEIQKNHSEVHFTQNFEKTVAWLQENLQKNDVVIVAGAGDVFRITEKLLTS